MKNKNVKKEEQESWNGNEDDRKNENMKIMENSNQIHTLTGAEFQKVGLSIFCLLKSWEGEYRGERADDSW